MANYRDIVSPSIRDMVGVINRCGVAKLRRYCKTFHPRMDFDKAILLIRSIAKLGYTAGAEAQGVTAQYAHKVLEKYCRMAKEAEKWQENL